ncbi:MarR family transcriptional regulator [Paenibacillus sedimenti]|uniref:MarR family transcriptional regulator n=1 Tax=Paenibacillus sedimenti TaxID=2770274 RepID=A0A926QKT3_9BACL|nr:MarR family transcriptional regulator [Paenibacillus sedimenti]MBD0382123.1 MarR family transcriptional regulator [Paenibacillus sedimenti]
MNNHSKIAPLFGKVQKMVQLYEEHEKREKDIFIAVARQYGIKNLSGDLTISETHVIEQIGNHETISVTRLAEKMGMTKDAITKISAKLLDRGWIEKFAMSGNRKEVQFRLTPEGRVVYEVHEQYHLYAEKFFQEFINKYTDAEFEFIDRLIGDITQAIENSMAAMGTIVKK